MQGGRSVPLELQEQGSCEEQNSPSHEPSNDDPRQSRMGASVGHQNVSSVGVSENEYIKTDVHELMCVVEMFSYAEMTTIMNRAVALNAAASITDSVVKSWLKPPEPPTPPPPRLQAHAVPQLTFAARDTSPAARKVPCVCCRFFCHQCKQRVIDSESATDSSGTLEKKAKASVEADAMDFTAIETSARLASR